MPRHAHDDIRVAHKEAWNLRHWGYEVVLLCRHAPVERYLGMHVVASRACAQGLLRPILNLPRLLQQTLSLKADLYIIENPDTLPLGFLLLLMRKRVVYSAHEDFVRKTEIHPSIPKTLMKVLGLTIVACEFVLTRLAAATIVTQPSVQRRYRPHAILVENAPLTHGPVMRRAERIYSQLADTDMPTLIYAGAIRRNRGLDRMLEIIERLNEIRPWKLKLIGHFVHNADLASAAAHTGWRYVEYLGRVPHAVSLAHIRSADIGLALLDDVGGYSESSITKLYEYMLMETPFVASNFSMWRDSIEDTPAGLFVDFDDIATLTLEIDELFADRERYQRMQAAGRRFVELRFNWHLVSAPTQHIVRDLLRERPSISASDEREQRQSSS